MSRLEVSPEETEEMLRLAIAKILDISEHPEKHSHRTAEGLKDLESLRECCTLFGSIDPYLIAAHNTAAEALITNAVFNGNDASSNGGGL